MECNCCERCGAAAAEMSCIRGLLSLRSVITSPSFYFDGLLFIECNCTTACNGQTFPGAQHCSMTCTCVGFFFLSFFFCLCHAAAWSSFPASINASCFLNPLILFCIYQQLRVETTIKEEFEPVMSSDLLCLRVGWVFMFTVSQCHICSKPEKYWFNVERRVGCDFCFERSVRKILPITDFYF